VTTLAPEAAVAALCVLLSLAGVALLIWLVVRATKGKSHRDADRRAAAAIVRTTTSQPL